MTSPGRCVLPLVAALVLLGPESSGALEIRPTLTAGGLYTDNVLLAPKGQEEDDIAGLIQPGIRILSSGNRYDLSLDYSLQAFFYADQPDADETYSFGRALLGIDVLPDLFSVTGFAAISQTVIDPLQPVPISNLPIVANRQDQTELRVTPEWRQQIGSSFLRLSYSQGQIKFEEGGFQDVTFREWNNSLQGPERERGLTWSIAHQYGAYDYEVIEVARQSLEAFLFSEVGGGWAPFLSAGVESDFAEPTNSDLSYFIWSAGLRYQGPRTRAEFAYGERSFGSNVRVLLERSFGELGDRIQLSYSETPTTPINIAAGTLPPLTPAPTDPFQPPFDPGPGTSPGFDPNAPPLILPPGLAQSLLARRAEAGFFKTLVRTRLSFSIFVEEFESVPFEGGVDQSLLTNSQEGVRGEIVYTVGSKVTLRSNLLVADQKFQTDATQSSRFTQILGRVGLDYQLGTRTFLSFFVGTDQRQNARGASGPETEYTQGFAGVLVTRNFF